MAAQETGEAPTRVASLVDTARRFADEARALIHTWAIDSAPDEPAVLSGRLEAMAVELRTELLDHRSLARTPSVAADVCEALLDVRELQQDLREHIIRQRFHALSRIHAGLSRLRDQPTVAALLEETPQEICHCCDFDRALVSRVRGSTWVPEVVCVAAGQDPEVTQRTTNYIDTAEIPLTPMLLETELARRAAPALVTDPANDPRTYKPLVNETRTRAYVAAPVVHGRRVIGFLHADTFGSERPLSTVDRDNLFTFAEGFALIFERVVLLERLEKQRKRVREAFRSAEGYIDELCDAEVKLTLQERSAPAVTATAADMFHPSETLVHLLLSAREREVLQLMAGGARNSAVADVLVISEATVKSHVQNICRKLRASNRADAVSRYLQLVMKSRP